MEEHNAASFLRLPPDERSRSSLSLDSCEFCRTETFDRLPSVPASRPEQRDNIVSRGHSDQASTPPLRSLLMRLQGKRDARIRRNIHVSSDGFWESRRWSQSINRICAQIGDALSGLLPWQHTLHVIEGRFGVGVKAYFGFLRYLVYLNLLHGTVILSFILVPTAVYGRSNGSEPLRFRGNDSALDVFLGSGYLGRSPVFFGFYTRGSLNMACLNTPLLYLAGILAIFSLSLIMVVRRTVVGYKHTWILGKRHRTNVSHKIFCGWDFNIRDSSSAALKRSFIRNDLKVLLEEQSFSLREAQRTLGQRLRLHLFRFILNLLVVSLLGGAFHLVYISTQASQKQAEAHWLVSLVLQFLPPLTISSVNLFLPHVFRKISSFEDYSLTTQVNATLVRSIFLKLSSLGIYLYFIFKRKQHDQCWENNFGREMYKLCIFTFLASFCSAFLFSYPRKLVQERYPSSLLARLSGKRRFLIPFNVLDLVYSQTVSWAGVYYCPLLPLIGNVTLAATFYIKKFTLLRCCVAEQRMFRASSSSVLFHFMLLLGLLMAKITLGFNFYRRELMSDLNISSCGPFGDAGTVFNVTRVCVASLPGPVQNALRYLTSEAFALPLVLAEVIILTSYVSQRRANQKAIERLKDMLIMSSSDKRFLVKQHATILRCQRKTRGLFSSHQGAGGRDTQPPEGPPPPSTAP
ncbi:transmembrane channel-like protein 8 [Brachionichthys hirsutus]|uniref:transmembrane channel-like protein 8 n=1 Tax=Brachionichthys hirsutus TaxID=412623 RepID=UPI003604FF7A